MKYYFLIAAMLLCFCNTWANNIRVTNVSLHDQNRNSNIYKVSFDIAWDNSWRTSTNESNWDAAWIFIKYRPIFSTEWHHAKLLRTNQVFTDQTLMEVKSSMLGAIMQRGVDGIGNISYENATLTWNYGEEIEDDIKVEVAVYAIEMVYVPRGPFSIGDGSEFVHNVLRRGGSTASGSTIPYPITSESELNLGGGADENLCSGGIGDDFPISITGIPKILPASFPKGYDGFYCMKYECSQGQYTAFLNSISPEQAYKRYSRPLFNVPVDGNTIIEQLTGFLTTTPDRACNRVSFLDAAAYADWAGMRMMTELEYEKACRGGLTPGLFEYAWGAPWLCLLARNGSGVTENDGQENELIPSQYMCSNTDSLGNAAFFDFWDRPLRCGIFAASSPIKNRTKTGATYYGIMEMSGNLGELCVGISTGDQRSFTGTEGGGSLLANGDPSFYPSFCTVRGQQHNGFLHTVSLRPVIQHW